MLLALLPWLACAGAHDTGEAQPATLQRVEVVIKRKPPTDNRPHFNR